MRNRALRKHFKIFTNELNTTDILWFSWMFCLCIAFMSNPWHKRRSKRLDKLFKSNTSYEKAIKELDIEFKSRKD